MVNKQLTEALTAKTLVTRLNYPSLGTAKEAAAELTTAFAVGDSVQLCNRGTHGGSPEKPRKRLYRVLQPG